MFHQIHRARRRDEHFGTCGPSLARRARVTAAAMTQKATKITKRVWFGFEAPAFTGRGHGARVSSCRALAPPVMPNVRRSNAPGTTMRTRYRRWKHALALPLVALAVVLMRREPHESAGWFAGIGIVVLLGAAYVGEEIVWMVQNRGRPCGGCGQRIRLRPFSLRIHCPHCGRLLE